jgi:predicted amidohydrolase
MTFAIAGIQMHVRYGQDNLALMESKLHALMVRFPWVEMVVFSELAAFGGATSMATTLPGPIEERFQALARKYSLWLIPGSLFEKSEGKIYNTASVIDPNGVVVGRYRKMFPFRPYEVGVTAGSKFLTFDVPNVGRFGLSICYDMWFPETTRTLAAMGAEVILHPSLTDTIDRDAELAIARASAATNQCFFFDINGVGDGGNGQSIVVRPTGTVIHTAGHGEEMIPVQVNMETVRTNRSTGLFGLGQVLKSFRDRDVEFTVYDRSGPGSEYLQALGPLVTPGRKIREGGVT